LSPEEISHPAQTEQTWPLRKRPAKEPRLINFGKKRFEFRGSFTERIQPADQRTNTRPSHRANAEAFPFEHAEHAQMRHTARAAATQSQSYIHKVLLADYTALGHKLRFSESGKRNL
jgi:hypothetical protein